MNPKLRHQNTLIIFNYTMDESHPLLAHQTELVKALSMKFEKIIVLTGSSNWVPERNHIQVISTNWIQGHNVRNVLRFYASFFGVLLKERRFIVFSHMTLVQSFLAAIPLRITKNPHFLWYAHKQNSFMLRFVGWFSSGVITSTRGSCPIQGNKVTYIGQSINETDFIHESKLELPLTKFVHIGRSDPSKNIELLIETVNRLRHANPEFELTLVGNPSNAKYSLIHDELQRKWRTASREGWLTFSNAVPRNLVPKILSQNHIFIHAYSGSLDKSLIEATMSGLPVATINQEYRNDFGSWESASADLDLEIRAILSKDLDTLASELGRRREIAIKLHSLQHWISLLASVLISNQTTNPSIWPNS